MPKRTDIKKILIIGSGPIIISQACEFDYSGTQACKALKEEGYEVILVNSNPATIMTDPETADRTYVEPITPEAVEKIIAKERPDALLPTLGGQTGLNTAVAVAEAGVLDEIRRRDDRGLARRHPQGGGPRALPGRPWRRSASGFPGAASPGRWRRSLPSPPRSAFPIIIRPSFTLGGTGSGVAYNREELAEIAKGGLDASMIHEIMLEQSALGWKEYELEVMRDKADNVRHHLFHREHGSHGGPHGRVDHRRPGPDPDRRRVPADAGRGHRHHAGDRRRDGRLQRPVRRSTPTPAR